MKQYFWIFGFLLVILACNPDDEISNVSNSLILDSSVFISLDTLNPDYQAIFDETSGIYGIRLDDNISDGATSADVYGITYQISVSQGAIIETVSDTIMVRVGVNAIYPIGIDEALQLTKEGETWKFIIPSNLSYPNYPGDDLIPFMSSIEFDVNVVEVVDQNEINQREFDFLDAYVSDTLNFTESNQPQRVPIDGFTDIYKLTIQEGDTLSPSVGNIVSFSYDGTSLPDSLRFDVGELEILFEGGQIISGLYNALGTMKRGERALILMPSSAAYAESARVFPNIVDDGSAYQDLQVFLLDKNAPIIPTYASKVTPYEILTFDLSLRSID